MDLFEFQIAGYYILILDAFQQLDENENRSERKR